MPKYTRLTPIKECDKNSAEYIGRIRLGEIMKAKKITQTVLSKCLGVKQGTVSNWKTGRTPLPSNYVYPICKMLNISPNELFGFNEWIKTKK